MTDRTCICVTCGGTFPRAHNAGPIPRYCSEDCKPRCSVEGCDDPVRKRGWCAAHYSQWRRLGEVKPFTYKWATEHVCVVCGADVQPGHGRRKHCSGRCQVLDSIHKGSRPKYRQCVRCGVLIDLLALTPAGQFRRVDVKICGTCRRARSLRHKVSVSELVRGAFPVCGICDELVDMTLAFPDPGSPSIDHVVPYAHGGSHDLSNLQLAHLRCNHVKSDRVGFVV